MVCVYVFGSGLWTCILLYVNEAGRHHRGSVAWLGPDLAQTFLLYILGFDEIILNTQYVHTHISDTHTELLVSSRDEERATEVW